MTALEQQVWAAVYASEFAWWRETYHHDTGRTETISGFSCAEVADVAVEKLREAFTGSDAAYLIPVIEGVVPKP